MSGSIVRGTDANGSGSTGLTTDESGGIGRARQGHRANQSGSRESFPAGPDANGPPAGDVASRDLPAQGTGVTRSDRPAVTGSDGEVLLELKHVSHSYTARSANFEHGEHRVLDDVSLQVRRGQTLGVIGRNGAGKTTLLRLMAGILAPNRGQIVRAPGVTCSLLSLGLGFQDQLTGRDNARLSALLQGASRAEAAACLESINAFAELGPSFDEPVKTYSAGMRARLGFATALQTRVDVLLIDEVLAVGDRQFRAKAAAAMQQHLKGAQTVVLVSHAEQQIQRLCTVAAWIEAGRLRSYGEAAEVVGRYVEASGNASESS